MNTFSAMAGQDATHLETVGRAERYFPPELKSRTADLKKYAWAG